MNKKAEQTAPLQSLFKIEHFPARMKRQTTALGNKERVLAFYRESAEALSKGAPLQRLIDMPVREQIGRFKYTVENDGIDAEYHRILSQLSVEIANAFVKEDV